MTSTLRTFRGGRAAGFARTAALGLALALLAALPALAAAQPASKIELVEQRNPDTPLVAVRLMFRAGSIHDPQGKEGLAALTAMMIGQGGTEQHTYSQLLDLLYPMAGSIDVDTDREVTVISGESHVDNLAKYTGLLTEAVLHPAFAQSDFDRNKSQLQAYLTTTLRAANDELLGLEALQDQIWRGLPYGHPSEGTVQGLANVTLDDVKAFYHQNFTRANLILGVAGGYPEDYPGKLQSALAGLPEGSGEAVDLPPLPKPKGREFTLIAKQTDSTEINFGYAIPVTRADHDYYPLMVANSYLGEHRTFNGVLMNQLRGKRGLNYGDYSYIEFYAAPPFTSRPTPNVPRHQQYFSVWIRPVVPKTAHFALRAGLYYVDRLIDKGMTKDEFELTRDYLVNYSKLWAQTLSERLGVQMDSRFYGTPYWIDEIEKQLEGLTVDEVNAAVKKYLQTDAYEAVVVTDDAPAMAEALKKDEPSPMEYNSEVDDAVKQADKSIVDLKVAPTSVEIVPVSEMFEGTGAKEAPAPATPPAEPKGLR